MNTINSKYYYLLQAVDIVVVFRICFGCNGRNKDYRNTKYYFIQRLRTNFFPNQPHEYNVNNNNNNNIWQ